jgi:oxygen-independent coproporphyrinogen III oxidase
MRSLLPSLLRMAFPERHPHFSFTREHAPLPVPGAPLDLYVHLPFCRQICAFCPYVKHTYDAHVAASYQDALLRELQCYRSAWGEAQVRSVYFGGGTPSLTPGIIESTISWLARSFHLTGEIGAEVHPLDATHEVLRRLKDTGVTMVSLGVQSFNTRLLGLLGRGYDEALAMAACDRVLDAGFETADIDLIFALPGQRLDECVADFARVADMGFGQLSAYPLIQFADTALAARLREEGVRLPSPHTERRMLCAIVAEARRAGYERSSIWSFNRPGAARYTTVTRDSFLGIGAGASSRLAAQFRVNTFSIPDYVEATRAGSPVALSTRMNEGDRMAYWLFWRCYDTAIDLGRFEELFGREPPGHLQLVFQLLCATGLARREGSILRLTDTGAYLFHLVEKHYTHSYLEKLWAACRCEAWPQRVVL